MKLVMLSAFMVLTSVVFGQQWKDSLAAARKAYEQKNYSKALKLYQSAQKNAPKDIDLSKEIGQATYKSSNYSDAETLFRQQASTEKSAIEKAKAYHNWGNSLIQQKKYGEAIEAYKQSLRNDASNNKTRHNLSEAMRLRKEEEQKQDNQNNQNQNNQNQNQNNQNQNQNNNKQQQNNKQNQTNNSENNHQKDNSNNSQLQDKAIEKKLDELMKQDASTKRKLGQGKNPSGAPKSGNDW
ncbi:MAG TPA: tetratricopeptide repeat protein [Taishania sp.]|nr:tetratricopeptide repeat protein [Taishania sp.]